LQRSGVSIKEIAAHIGAEQLGAPRDLILTGIASLASATPTDLSFVVSEQHLEEAKASSAGVLIALPDLIEDATGKVILAHAEPYLAYARATELFAQSKQKSGISDLACISKQANLGKGVNVGPFAVIEAGANIGDNCNIGAGCCIGRNSVIGSLSTLDAKVTIYHEVEIGLGCRISSGTVIGSDGFGFAPSKEGWVKIHQLGRVIIGNRVDIGANVSISRGALDDTLIGNDVIIDDLVLIAHNVEIGDHTALAGQIGIAGSSKVGKNCTMGGQVAIAGHLTIADDVHITGKSMVTRSIAGAGQYSSGMPAAPSKEWRRNTVRLRQIEKLIDRVTALENKTTHKAEG
jgi:UDP-3-O-[3-hydroxymyristoyl] glucosamine N-acyltransferase